jgi:hypothetical protein
VSTQPPSRRPRLLPSGGEELCMAGEAAGTRSVLEEETTGMSSARGLGGGDRRGRAKYSRWHPHAVGIDRFSPHRRGWDHGEKRAASTSARGFCWGWSKCRSLLYYFINIIPHQCFPCCTFKKNMHSVPATALMRTNLYDQLFIHPVVEQSPMEACSLLCHWRSHVKASRAPPPTHTPDLSIF